MDQATIQQYVRIAGVDPGLVVRQALDDFKSHTVGPSGARGEFSSQCPGHEDSKASLRWRPTKDGRVIMTCHAGCDLDEILEPMGLQRYQLYPSQVQYDYLDREGTYWYTVERQNLATGGKGFKQFVRAMDGSITHGRPRGVPDLLWLEPDLWGWVEDRRAEGARGGELWICEGEKDAMVCAPEVGEQVFVTTSPGGAQGWQPGHTATVAALCDTGVFSQIRLLGDRDPAGIQRLSNLSRDLSVVAGPDVALDLVMPEKTDDPRDQSKDVAELIDRHPDDWRDRLVDGSGQSLALLAGSALTGGLVLLDQPGGRKVLGMHLRRGESTVEKIAMTCDLQVQAYDDRGWDVLVVPSALGDDPHEERLTRDDLTDGRALSSWTVKTAGVGKPPQSLAWSDTAGALTDYLNWDAKIRGAVWRKRSEFISWVDVATGEPSVRPSGRMAFLDETGWPLEGIGEQGAGVRGPSGLADARWGQEGPETGAAWALAQVLTYGEPALVAQVAGWCASVVLAPWFTKHLTIKPGLAALGPSNSGKTNGAIGMLLQLIGCEVGTMGTKVSMRRSLSAGVSVACWFDDDSKLDQDDIKDVFRGTTARSSYTISNADAGATSTARSRLLACPVITAEGVAWMNETAMQDRFVHLKPRKPQGRMSVMPGRAMHSQWEDALDLKESLGGSLTSVAGHVIVGLARQAGRVDEWAREVGPAGIRAEYPLVATAIGVRAIRAWLDEVRVREGADWPADGEEWPEGLRRWDWLVGEADQALADVRGEIAAVGKDSYDVPALVSIVLAGLKQEQSRTVVADGQRLIAGIEVCRSGGEFAIEVRRQSGVYGLVDSRSTWDGRVPLVLVDKEERVWIRVAGLADWWKKANPRGIEERLTGFDALNKQMQDVTDDPEWATVKKGGGKETGGIRVTVGGRTGQRFKYHRLTARHSAIVLDDE